MPQKKTQAQACVVLCYSISAPLQVATIGNATDVSVKESMREDLFRWLAKHAPGLVKSAVTLQPLQNQQLYKYIVEALQDKAPVVRQQAQAFLVHCIRIAGTNAVNTVVNNVSSATVRDGLAATVRAAAENAKTFVSEAPDSAVAAPAERTASGSDGVGVTAAFNTSSAPVIATITSSTGIVRPVKAGTGAKAPAFSSATLKPGATLSAAPPRVPLTATLTRRSSAPSVSAPAPTGGVGALKDYRVFAGAPGAREHRARASNRSKWIVTSDTLAGASAASFVKSLFSDLNEEWRVAMVASKPLLDDLFASGDTAPGKMEGAMAFLTRQLMECSARVREDEGGALVGEGADQLDALMSNVDLLFKYVAVTLMDVKEKSSAIASAHNLLETITSVVGRFGWVLNKVDGDFIMPTLCEKSGHKREDTRNRYFALLDALVVLLSVNQSASGYPEGLTGVLETYIVPTSSNTKNTTTKVLMLTLMKTFIDKERTHRVLKRNAYLAVAKTLSEPKCVHDVREAALNVFVSVFVTLQCNYSMFYKLISSDERGLTGRGLVGVDSRALDLIKARLEQYVASHPTPPPVAAAVSGAGAITASARGGSSLDGGVDVKAHSAPGASDNSGREASVSDYMTYDSTAPVGNVKVAGGGSAPDLASIDPFHESIAAPPRGAYEAADPKRSRTSGSSPTPEEEGSAGTHTTLTAEAESSGMVPMEPSPAANAVAATAVSVGVSDGKVGGAGVLAIISGGYSPVDRQLTPDCPQYLRTFMRALITQARQHLAHLSSGGADAFNRISGSSTYKAARAAIDEVYRAITEVEDEDTPAGTCFYLCRVCRHLCRLATTVCARSSVVHLC